MIKQKGFKDYLNDDPSLKEKMTYEEFENSQKVMSKNDRVEEVYNSYLETVKGWVSDNRG